MRISAREAAIAVGLLTALVLAIGVGSERAVDWMTCRVPSISPSTEIVSS